MRDIIIMIAIIAIILSGDMLMKNYLNPATDEIIAKLEELKQNTIKAKETEDRSEIKEQIKEVEHIWNDHLEIWSTIVMHQELDNIAQPLARARLNINDGNLEDALQEIETTIFYLNHVKEREKFNLKNIF